MKTRSTQQLVLAAALATVSATTLAQSFTIEGIPIGTPFTSPMNNRVSGDEPLDVDGDGLADVALAKNGELFVMRGQTNGSFSAPVSTAFPLPFPQAFADANGDGRDDAWYLSGGNSTVTAYFAQQDATFSGQVATTLNYPAETILVKDLDDDGIPDLVAAQFDGFRISIFKGQGDGSMVLDREVLVGDSDPRDLASGDVNGDGHEDIVVVTLGGSSRALWVSFGSPTGFGTPVLISDDAGGNSIFSVVDVTGDNAEDILVRPADVFSNDVSAIIFEGGPTVANGVVGVPLAGPDTQSLTAADIDANGLTDLLLVRLDDMAIDVWLQTSNGVLEKGPPIALPDDADDLAFIADVSQDGMLDLVFKRSDRVVVRRGTGTGAFGFGMPSTRRIDVGDFNDDGLTDVAAVEYIDDDPQLVHYRGLIGGGFERREGFTLPVFPQATEVVDVDNDGDLDVLVVAGPVRAYLNNGGTLSAPITTLIGTGSRHLGDFSGDGIPDVMVVTSDATRFDGLGDGTFEEATVIPDATSAGFGSIEYARGDADGDGVVDLIITSKVDTLAVTLQGIVDLGNGAGDSFSAIALGDLENDGVPELILAKPLASTGERGIQVRRPNASGTFVNAFFIATDEFVQDFELADVDGDGDDDLLVADDLIRIGIDDGMGGMTLTALPDTGDTIFGIHIADMDGDGLADALISSFREARVLKNAASVWSSLGQSLAGSAGLSRLDGSGPLTSNGDIALVVRSSLPSAATTLVVGFSQVSAPFKGGVLVPSPDILITGLATDALGELMLPASLPADVPAALELFFQAWQVEPTGFPATTAVRGTTY